eukprot:CAMPEP_0182536500 /NCGR_PEP_ID=MMETSP1323-20130603/20144_1 /TAXON_ID=236787 /ORGANISM="Florenciella parvula, Strain RCC1693" /LENGTH=54 /DNA_ID=CAMNT_0024746747 /DNA_START=66 /DNA_END=230 /DNA_ORIENTATION=+
MTSKQREQAAAMYQSGGMKAPPAKQPVVGQKRKDLPSSELPLDSMLTETLEDWA